MEGFSDSGQPVQPKRKNFSNFFNKKRDMLPPRDGV